MRWGVWGEEELLLYWSCAWGEAAAGSWGDSGIFVRMCVLRESFCRKIGQLLAFPVMVSFSTVYLHPASLRSQYWHHLICFLWICNIQILSFKELFLAVGKPLFFTLIFLFLGFALKSTVKNKLTSKIQNGVTLLGTFVNGIWPPNRTNCWHSPLFHNEVQNFPAMNFCSLYFCGVFSSWMLNIDVAFVVCVVYQQSSKIFA